MKVLKQRRGLWRVVVAVAGIIFLFVMFRWFEQSQVYYPMRELEVDAAGLGRPFENVRFKTEDGVGLHGWFFPANTNSPRADWAFLICHGNGGNISHCLGLCDALLKTGVSVLVFDYRGYGRSEGKPSEEGTYLDAQAAHRWLREKGFRGECIIAFGQSLGGGVASELALREKIGGLVLQSSFTSIPDIGAEIYPWLPVRLIATIHYDTRAKLPRIHVPVLVMHSRTDDLVKFHHAERNFAAANEPKLFCELNGGHNETDYDSLAFGAAIEKFLKMVEETSAR